MSAAVILDYVRTPIGKAGGNLASVRPDDLVARAIAALIARHPSFETGLIDEVYIGCANQAGEDNRNVARMGLLLAGLPSSIPGITVNRLCASGLDAVGAAARAIAAGEIDAAIAGGVESMSRAPFVLPKSESAYQRTASIEDTTVGWRLVNPAMKALYGVDSMPQTAENVADAFGISRADQDAFALRSQQRAAASSEWYSDEIVPVTVVDRKGVSTEVRADEQPRPATTLGSLGSLRPIVQPEGTVTAGNSSSINDGAAAILLVSEALADRLSTKPLARILGLASAGVEPRVMGVGPVPAVERLCRRLHLAPSDFAAVELNEAFASQSLACLRGLGVADDAEHVNRHGGAIALGHPLGMSGTRLVGTLSRQLQKSGERYGLATMCVGVGQGVAMAIERL